MLFVEHFHFLLYICCRKINVDVIRRATSKKEKVTPNLNKQVTLNCAVKIRTNKICPAFFCWKKKGINNNNRK